MTTKSPTTLNRLLDVLGIVLLLLAAFKLSGAGSYHRYGYYESLRAIVTIAWGFGAYRFWLRGVPIATIVCCILAVLFNPVVPVTMRKYQWLPIDHTMVWFAIGAACGLGFLIYRSFSTPVAEHE